MIARARPMAPPHLSPSSAVSYLLEGRVTLVGETRYDVEPGGVVVFPSGTPSTFEVLGDSPDSGPSHSGDRAGRFFAAFSESVPRDQPVQDSMEAILSVTRRHGVQLVGA